MTPEEKELLIKISVDQRDNEIDRLWTRSNFMLVVVAATFAAYARVYNEPLNALLVAVVGACSSAAWFAITMGSKWWQDNWENKAERALADLRPNFFGEIQGRQGPYLGPLPLLRFSVVRVVLITALALTLLWIAVAARLNSLVDAGTEKFSTADQKAMGGYLWTFAKVYLALLFLLAYEPIQVFWKVIWNEIASLFEPTKPQPTEEEKLWPAFLRQLKSDRWEIGATIGVALLWAGLHVWGTRGSGRFESLAAIPLGENIGLSTMILLLLFLTAAGCLAFLYRAIKGLDIFNHPEHPVHRIIDHFSKLSLSGGLITALLLWVEVYHEHPLELITNKPDWSRNIAVFAFAAISFFLRCTWHRRVTRGTAVSFAIIYFLIAAGLYLAIRGVLPCR